MNTLRCLITTAILLSMGTQLYAQTAKSCPQYQEVSEPAGNENNNSKTGQSNSSAGHPANNTTAKTAVAVNSSCMSAQPCVPCQPRAPMRGRSCGTGVYVAVAGIAIVTAFAIIGGVFSSDPAHAHPEPAAP